MPARKFTMLRESTLSAHILTHKLRNRGTDSQFYTYPLVHSMQMFIRRVPFLTRKGEKPTEIKVHPFSFQERGRGSEQLQKEC